MSPETTFAARLTALREAAGLSQYRLARDIGVSRQYISALELGERDRPSFEVLCAIADALGVDVGRLRVD
jgi:transcriptional regulator with XRE-family HTH domain